MAHFSVSRLTGLAVFGACLAFCCKQATAQYPIIELTSLSQHAAKAGSELELRVSAGARIEEVRELRFSHPGIVASLLMGDPLPFDDQPQPRFGSFRVKVDVSVPPGRYEVRAVGRHGISNPRVFLIHGLDTDDVAGRSSNPASATPIELNQVYHAKAPGANVHYYSLKVSPEQSLRVDCLAARIDSRMIPTLRLQDLSGRTIQVRRGSDEIDPMIEISSTEPAEYLLSVHDTLYRAGEEYGYLLVAQPSESVTELCGTSDEVETGQLPLITATAAVAVVNDSRWSLAKAVEETSDAKKIKLPATLKGSFDDASDEDVYEFAGNKGDRWSIDLASHRFGEPTDGRIILYRGDPQADGVMKWVQVNLSESSQALGDTALKFASLDPSSIVTLPVDGTYRLHVRDLDNGSALSKSQRYKLRIAKPAPDFQLAAYRPYPSKDANATHQQGVCLFRGGTDTIRVFCLRKDGWTGPVQVSVQGLPAGVTCAPATVAANQDQVNLTLVTAADAPPSVAALSVVGTAILGDADQKRTAQPVSIQWGRGGGREFIRSRLCQALFVYVSDKDTAPFSVQVGDGSVAEVKKGQELKLPLKLTRSEQAKNNCVLRPKNLPPKVTSGDVTIAADKTDGTLVLKVAADAPVGTYSIWLQTETKIKWKANPQALQRAEAYRALLQKLHDDPARAAEKPKILEAIKAADQRVNAAKGSANPQDLTVYPPSPHFTIRIVDPS